MGTSNGQKCFLLRIELLHTHRPIWREVILPADLGLDVMHDVIQETMGWENYHLHQFEHKGVRYDALSPDEEGIENPEFLFSLKDLLKRAGSRMAYTYDFGDDWVHSITLKKTLPWDEEKIFTCTGGEGACPLEDCGGAYGHQRICHYLENPKKNNDGFMPYEEWVPEDYDPDFVDFEQIRENLESLKLEDAEPDTDVIDEFLGDAEDPELMESSEILPGFEDLFGQENEDEAAPPSPYEDLSPSDLAQFGTLLELGTQVREAEPWKKLWDQDIFGIRDPESGLVDIVSILGRGGEVFAIHVHRPPESYDLWKSMIAGTAPMHDFVEYLRKVRMLELQFTTEKELEDDDVELYEKLNLPSPKRGKNRWMLARRFHPRSIPWFADPEEIPFLIRGTALTLRLLNRLRAEPDGPIATFYKTRMANGTLLETLPIFSLPQGKRAEDWDSWSLTVDPFDWNEAGGVDLAYEPGEFELERIASLPQTDETWEAGAIHLGGPVGTETGPVIPILAIAAPTEIGEDAPTPYISTTLSENPGECLWKAFCQTALQREERPKVLWVSTETAEKTFETPAKKLGMRIELVDQFANIGTLFSMMQTFAP
ncbi:plasmid pRiA4b ORF-3 family protein [Puniceicoccus vermicola]|uniref:Plasmid pRiA4b ORF-3 family protein n=1 Tax=Puniceicoccus vermicola TaxID=388746 RepID=A0A7X1AUP6_9BACT|nr:plasmid pRiA4b ORF-3 family protein [Puniceicoccus vermicola]MBC2600167.1 plasmid pRiA4b ORF-3 family protein [Puniceicoccus vermicola]